MSRACDLTGKRMMVGNKVSHSNIKTKRRFYPNLQKKKLFIPELNKTINIEVSARGMRTMKKRGTYATLLKAGLIEAK